MPIPKSQLAAQKGPNATPHPTIPRWEDSPTDLLPTMAILRCFAGMFDVARLPSERGIAGMEYDMVGRKSDGKVNLRWVESQNLVLCSSFP